MKTPGIHRSDKKNEKNIELGKIIKKLEQNSKTDDVGDEVLMVSQIFCLG